MIEFIDNHHALYPAVKQLGKKNAATLGFMPEGGFDDYAIRKNIIIYSENSVLQGYLMYRKVDRFSRVTIVHLAVDDDYRGKGVSTALLEALKKRFKDTGIAGISLNCRKDFKEPSKVWERNDFIPKQNRRSRSMEEHYLTTWWFDFNPRTLYSMMYEENGKVRALMDANIIIKLRDAGLGTKFKNAKEDPRCLLADWLVDETELCYAPEVFIEINRDTDIIRGQATINYVNNAFTQAIFDTEEKNLIAKELEQILPGNSDNTISDRKQVASCIAADIPYFITFDEVVIKKKEAIKTAYDVDIYTPQEFLLKIDQLLHREDYSPSLLKGVAFHSVSLQDAINLNTNIDFFLQKSRNERKLNFANIVTDCVNNGGKLYIIDFQGQKKAFYGVQDNAETSTIYFLRLIESALSASLMYQIVTEKLLDCANHKRKFFILKEMYLKDEHVNYLKNFGFQLQSQGVFVKEIKNEIVTISDQSWQNLSQEEIARREKVSFPLKVRDLEIPTYIIPIKALWAGNLFDCVISEDNLFGANPSKLWNFENVYYRSRRPITEQAPGRILWYVCNRKKGEPHSKMVVASSYLNEVYTGKAKELFRQFKHYGIYEWQDLNNLRKGETDEDIRALKFSHTELFPYPVHYNVVQEILHINGFRHNTFNSPLKVSKEVFFDIYRKGMGMD